MKQKNNVVKKVKGTQNGTVQTLNSSKVANNRKQISLKKAVTRAPQVLKKTNEKKLAKKIPPPKTEESEESEDEDEEDVEEEEEEEDVEEEEDEEEEEEEEMEESKEEVENDQDDEEDEEDEEDEDEPISEPIGKSSDSGTPREKKGVTAKQQKTNGSEVKKDKKKCTIVVSNMSNNTSAEQIKELFQQYGTVEKITLKTVNTAVKAFVMFDSESAASEAEKNFHNTIVDGCKISVKPFGVINADPKLTVVISKLDPSSADITADQIHEAFSGCGEIDDVQLLCRKTVLAFVSFKKEESTSKAVAMSGTEIGGIKVEVKNFTASHDWTKKKKSLYKILNWVQQRTKSKNISQNVVLLKMLKVLAEMLK